MVTMVLAMPNLTIMATCHGYYMVAIVAMVTCHGYHISGEFYSVQPLSIYIIIDSII